MLINLETGDIFHDNFNMKKSFYGFLLNQQDENKQIRKKKISYAHSFKKYFHKLLQILTMKKFTNLIYFWQKCEMSI